MKQIVARCPDQLRRPFALWTREAAQVLLQQRFGLEASAWMKRRIRLTDRKVFLIVDRHRVHRSRKVKRWLRSDRERIRLDSLPPYRPELHPDEVLDQDVKSHALGRQRPASKQKMKASARSYLRCAQRRPRVVRNFFCEQHVRNAAAV